MMPKFCAVATATLPSSNGENLIAYPLKAVLNGAMPPGGGGGGCLVRSNSKSFPVQPLIQQHHQQLYDLPSTWSSADYKHQRALLQLCIVRSRWEWCRILFPAPKEVHSPLYVLLIASKQLHWNIPLFSSGKSFQGLSARGHWPAHQLPSSSTPRHPVKVMR